MIFEALSEAAAKGELLLTRGGMCRFHLRRDGQLTIREIVVLPVLRRRRIGRWLVTRAIGEKTLTRVVARCPADLPANAFWRALGFRLEETTEGKRPVNVWVLEPPCLASSIAPTVIPASPAAPSPLAGCTERDCPPPSTSRFSLPIRTGSAQTGSPT